MCVVIIDTIKFIDSCGSSFLIGIYQLHSIEEIGQGAFGRVSKTVWRGLIVAAREIPVSGNSRILQNELSVYR